MLSLPVVPGRGRFCPMSFTSAEQARCLIDDGPILSGNIGTVVGGFCFLAQHVKSPLVYRASPSISDEIGDISWHPRASSHGATPCSWIWARLLLRAGPIVSSRGAPH